MLALAVLALPQEARVKVALLLHSLLNVMKKELSQTFRDRRMLATLIVSPVLQLVVFGYAIDLDVDRIPTVVCDQDRTPESRKLAEAFFADRTFLRHADVWDPNAAQDALEAGTAAAALIVPHGFAYVSRAPMPPRFRSSWTGPTSRARRSRPTRRASSCSCTGSAAMPGVAARRCRRRRLRRA